MYVQVIVYPNQLRTNRGVCVEGFPHNVKNESKTYYKTWNVVTHSKLFPQKID